LDTEVFVLLDDCHATVTAPTSRLYSGFVREHRCTDPQALDALWQLVTADQQNGLHAAIFADYEWGAKLQHAGLRHLPAQDHSALRVFMFNKRELLAAETVALWLAQADGSSAPSPAGICDLQATVDQARFEQDIARIRSLISQGETYQVNYTFGLQGSQYGTPVGLYRRLRAMQPVAFGALACLPPLAEGSSPGQNHWVLSSSPELFVRNQAGQLSTRPMKGTAARLADPAADQQRAHWLAHDAKNRSENVMIVDLLRNDLGRISETGSVKVPKLFAVETYKTVHQMTSTVASQMRPEVRFPAVLRALFPCGSITGAPKLHTMDLIADLESRARGLYCGAIGWIDAPQTQSPAGDFCLSVAIRTLVLEAPQAGRRAATLGVGGGIVLDSAATDEYAETRAKTRFLTAMDPGFTLFETLRVSRGTVRHLPWHLQRLQASARALGFACDAAALQQTLAQQVAALDATQHYRLRLDLQHDGAMRLQHSILAPLPAGPARLVLASAQLPGSESALLNHKTSLRGSYDAAIQAAMAQGAFDAIFLNERGEVTEGARSSLLIRWDGRWWTPPLASGVLAGVMRQRLLQRCPAITEKVLRLDDLESAQALMVCSALRGLQRAHWLRDAEGEVVRV
jgi:para-aminobenzoate synthetase/4-amino-4-deoxychorismate lyase